MELTREQINHMHTAFDWDMDVCDIVDDVLDRIDLEGLTSDNLDEHIGEALDCALIYDDSQWALIKYYSDPSEPSPIGDVTEDFIIDFADALSYALGWMR